MSDKTEKSKVLTLVFTDLADSTALKTERGDAAVKELIGRHREQVTRLADQCSGRIIDWAGDGCFLTFETSSAGVMFALQLQQAHADNPDLPGVRIGIHMGEVSESGAPDGRVDINGLAVDLAARICGLAKPGQVLLSSSVYHSARQRMGVDTIGKPILWQAHGTYALKGFDEPLDISEAALEGLTPLGPPIAGDKAKLLKRAKRRKVQTRGQAGPERSPTMGWAGILIVLLLIALGALLWRQFGLGGEAAPPEYPATPDSADGIGDAPITSIAVLPLDNLMNDPEQDYFADGMTEAITAELAKISSLKVISRTSVLRYKDTTKPIPEIAAELGVEGLIEGSVLRDGDEVRITVQLIDAATDSHLWSENYTNTITSVLQLQSEVAIAIADEIRVTLTPDERERITSADDVDPEAYEFFLRGLEGTTILSPGAFENVLEQFTRAVEIDPNFAEAWEGISLAHSLLANFVVGSPREHFEASRRASRRALELDPSLGLSHAQLGFTDILLNQDWESARANMQMGRSLSPNDARIAGLHAYLYMLTGEWQAAFDAAHRAAELDPHWSFIVGTSGFVMSAVGQSDEGVRQLKRLVEEEPANTQSRFFLGNAYAFRGRFDEARSQLQEFGRLTGSSLLARGMLALANAASGEEAEARELLAELEQNVDPTIIASTPIPLAHAFLGDPDTALDWLERGAETPTFSYLVALRVYPFTPGSIDLPEIALFRANPRYWDLIERMHFPPLPLEHPGYEEEQAWLVRKAAEAEANAPITRLAVLPFDNTMRDPEQEYFVDGMTEALISELNKINALQVRGRTSVMRYKNSDKSPEEIARELAVQGFVEGSVLRENNQVRITARLIHAPSGTLRWDGVYVNTVTSILKLHSEMALAIAREVQANLTPQDAAELADAPDVNAAAYEEYLMGTFYNYQQSEQSFARAAAHFRRAIELDPDYADAHAGLGMALWAPSVWGWADPREYIEENRRSMERALALEPTSAFVQQQLGWMSLGYDYDRAEARRRFLRAIELDARSFAAHCGYAFTLVIEGRHDEALEEARIAVSLDPFNPQARDAVGDVYSMAQKHEDAIAWRERTLEIDPEHEGTLVDLMWEFSAVGRHEEALATHAVLARLRGKPDEPMLAVLLARAGREDEARSLLARAENGEMEGYVTPLPIACAYAALDEPDKAFEWLERSFEHRLMPLFFLTTYFAPLFESLEDDPRYLDLVRRIGLEDTLER